MTTPYNILSPQWAHAGDHLAEGVSERSVQPSRLTPAQRRKMVYEALVRALENKDEDAVKDILRDNPNVPLNETGWDVIAQTALTHFDEPCMRLLRAANLPVGAMAFCKFLKERFSNDLFEYVLKNQNTFEYTLLNLGLYDLYQDSLFNFSAPKEKIRNHARVVRLRLEQDLPQLTQQVRAKTNSYHSRAWSHMLLRLVLTYPTSMPVDDHEFVRTIPFEEIEKTLILARCKEKITTSELESINRFVREDPKRVDFWEQQERAARASRRQRIRFWTELGCDASVWDDTAVEQHMFDMCSQHNYIAADLCFLDDHRQTIFNFNLKNNKITLFMKEVHKISGCVPLTSPDLNIKMGWSILDGMLMHRQNQLIFIKLGVSRETIALGDLPGESPVFLAPCFVHNLILSGAPAVAALLKYPHGIELVNNTLHEDNNLLINWCKNTSLATVSELCAVRPEWKTWRDRNGNTLGHCVLAAREEINKGVLVALSKINPQWLIEKNANGLRAADIITMKKAGPEVGVWLERWTLSQAIKTDMDTSHTRAPSSSKRRM